MWTTTDQVIQRRCHIIYVRAILSLYKVKNANRPLTTDNRSEVRTFPHKNTPLYELELTQVLL